MSDSHESRVHESRVRQAADFLAALWPPSAPTDGKLVLAVRLPPAREGGPDRWLHRWGRAADPEAASSYAIGLDDEWGVHGGQLYIGVCRQDPQAALAEARRLEAERARRFGRRPRRISLERTRGYSHTTTAAPGVWADIDVAGPAHAGSDLPPSVDAALEHIVRRFPLPPTAIVHSGHGLHAWWAFVRPWEFAGPEDREEFSSLVRRFQMTLMGFAAERGWKIDSTSDLARVLRLPGGTNRKIPHEPVPVRLIHLDPQARYLASEIEAHCVRLPEPVARRAPSAPPRPDGPLPDAELIASRCAWLRHTRDDAKTLPEPEWYAMLGIVGRCRDGERVAHEWSRPYHRYTAQETEEKLAHALTTPPRTCANLAQFGRCGGCRFAGQIRSPVALGYERMPGERRTLDLPEPDRVEGTRLVMTLPLRIQRAFETGKATIYQLVEWLREGKSPGAVLAAAEWAVQGDVEAARKLYLQALHIARRRGVQVDVARRTPEAISR